MHLGTLLAKLAHWAYSCTQSNAIQFYAKGEKLQLVKAIFRDLKLHVSKMYILSE